MKIRFLRAVMIPLFLVGLSVSAALAQPVPKIGVFDSKTVFEQSVEGQRLQKMLNETREGYRTRITARENEVREAQQKLREGEFTLSDDRRSEMQKNLQRKMVALDTLKQEANNNLKIDLDDVQNSLERKLFQIIEELGAEQNFSIIFERNTQVVFASPSMDISSLIVERFNQKFPGTTD